MNYFIEYFFCLFLSVCMSELWLVVDRLFLCYVKEYIMRADNANYMMQLHSKRENLHQPIQYKCTQQ